MEAVSLGLEGHVRLVIVMGRDGRRGGTHEEAVDERERGVAMSELAVLWDEDAMDVEKERWGDVNGKKDE